MYAYVHVSVVTDILFNPNPTDSFISFFWEGGIIPYNIFPCTHTRTYTIICLNSPQLSSHSHSQFVSSICAPIGIHGFTHTPPSLLRICIRVCWPHSSTIDGSTALKHKLWLPRECVHNYCPCP